VHGRHPFGEQQCCHRAQHDELEEEVGGKERNHECGPGVRRWREKPVLHELALKPPSGGERVRLPCCQEGGCSLACAIHIHPRHWAREVPCDEF